MIELRNVEGEAIEPRSLLTFPGGEPHVEIHADLRGEALVIDARIGSADDFLRMLAVADAARRVGSHHLTLFLPYLPGARQDRVEPGSGNALTVKLYADIINAQRFDRVVVVDPHSDVATALLDRCSVITAAEILRRIYPERAGCTALICPDVGAEKRTLAAAKAMGGLPIVHARKHRDIATGKLDPCATPGPLRIRWWGCSRLDPR